MVSMALPEACTSPDGAGAGPLLRRSLAPSTNKTHPKALGSAARRLLQVIGRRCKIFAV